MDITGPDAGWSRLVWDVDVYKISVLGIPGWAALATCEIDKVTFTITCTCQWLPPTVMQISLGH